MKIADYQKEDWDDLIEKINEDYCVLFLGPGVYKNEDDKILNNVLNQLLKRKYEDEINDFFQEDGFIMLNDDGVKNDIFRIVKKFYAEQTVSDTLKKISQIPFHCVIAMTPDLLLKRCMDTHQIPHQFDYFSMTKAIESNLTEPKKNNPFLYYMFGSVAEDETIVLTHEDFFNYLQKIISNERLPGILTKTIAKATDLIFLGFEFEKWWVQLMLRLLGIHRAKGKKMALLNEQNSNFTKISKKQFKIKIIDDDASLFIDTLFKNMERNPNNLRPLNALTKQVDEAELEIKNQKISNLTEQILKAMDLQKEYEKKKMLTSIPREEMLCDEEIAKLNIEIKQKSDEMKALKNS